MTAGENPFYNEEWTGSAWMILRDYVAPRVLGRTLESAEEVYALTAHIRGHQMARGGLEAAIWDLEARQKRVEKLHIIELSSEDQRRFSEEWRIARLDPSGEAPEVDDLATIPFASRSLTHDGEKFWSNHRAANETISFTISP